MRLPDAGEYSTLGEWMEERFGAQGIELLRRGDVFAGHDHCVGADYPYTPGERIWVFRPVPDEPEHPIELDVVKETERYIVVDKPHGMASVPKASHVANSVLVAARRLTGVDLLVAAHRLDYETAGLLLLVKEPQWRGSYQKLFERRAITKTYRAIAPALPGAQEGTRWHSELNVKKRDGQMWVDVLRGPRWHSPSQGIADQLTPSAHFGERREPRTRTAHVVTDIELTQLLGGSSGDADPATSHGCENRALYTLRPQTGFTHQLRVAMNELGASICFDPAYPRLMSLEETAERPYPLQLLAASLDFVDPVDGEPVHLESSRTLALQ